MRQQVEREGGRDSRLALAILGHASWDQTPLPTSRHFARAKCAASVSSQRGDFNHQKTHGCLWDDIEALIHLRRCYRSQMPYRCGSHYNNEEASPRYDFGGRGRKSCPPWSRFLCPCIVPVHTRRSVRGTVRAAAFMVARACGGWGERCTRYVGSVAATSW